MATLEEITYNIKNVLEGGRSTQDSPFSLRQIAFFVIYYRSLLIRRETDYFKRLDDLEQDLGLVSAEVSEEPVGRADELPKAILKTSEEIPRPVRMRTRKPITFVGSPDLDEQYPFGERGQARYQSYGRYTSNDARSFWHDDHIYITSDKVANLVNDLTGGKSLSDLDTSVVEESITTIRIKGIFADPREAWSFRYDEPYNWETELPSMPEDLIQRITQSVLSGEGQAMVQQILDTELDRQPVNQEREARAE
jgi:hypothetical protein